MAGVGKPAPPGPGPRDAGSAWLVADEASERGSRPVSCL